MLQMKPLDPAFDLAQQLQAPLAGPVILVNLFTLDAADEAAFLTVWAEDARYMKARPGFLSTQLHRAIGPGPSYLNYALWESLDAFRNAFTDPGFRARLTYYPASATASPHLFQRVAVSGVCAA